MSFFCVALSFPHAWCCILYTGVYVKGSQGTKALYTWHHAHVEPHFFNKHMAHCAYCITVCHCYFTIHVFAGCSGAGQTCLQTRWAVPLRGVGQAYIFTQSTNGRIERLASLNYVACLQAVPGIIPASWQGPFPPSGNHRSCFLNPI